MNSYLQSLYSERGIRVKMKNINEKNKTLEDLKEESLLLWFANNVTIRSIVFALCLEEKNYATGNTKLEIYI